MNNNIKQNAIQQDLENSPSFLLIIIQVKKIAPLKTGPNVRADRAFNALQIGLNYLNTNKSNMMNFYALWLKLGAIKDIYRKLSNIKAIDSFEEVDGELKVRDPEGFVAIDPIGNGKG